MNPPSERWFPRLPLAKADAGAAAFDPADGFPADATLRS